MKRILALTAALATFLSLGTVPAMAQECPPDFDCTGFDRPIYSAVTGATVWAPSAPSRKLLYWTPEFVAGLGGTISRTTRQTGNGEFHLTGGFTLLSLDRKGHIGLLGAGTAINLSDFSANSAEIRDASRADGGYWGNAGYFNVVGTIIPVRIGPLSYSFSWNGHVRSLGVDRGRLHLITLDVVGLLRIISDN